MKIRAAVVREIDKLTIEEVELDPPRAGEVLVRIHAAGVCHSDLHTYRGELRATPTLVIEPGRSIVAPAAVALYRVGARKEIPGVRTYVSVDGGMADNLTPRPAVVLVKEGGATLIQRRETFHDLMARDLPLPNSE